MADYSSQDEADDRTCSKAAGPRVRRFERPIITVRASLTIRILTVNLLALALLGGSFFYLDNYRRQLLQERMHLAKTEAQITAEALVGAQSDRVRPLLAQIAKEQELRLRVYDADGRLTEDTFQLAEPSFQLVNPDSEPWNRVLARWLDLWMDAILGSPALELYEEPARIDAQAWPEIVQSRLTGQTQVFLRRAPDRSPVITAAAPVGSKGKTLLTTRNSRDITFRVRDARQTLAIIVATAIILSAQLSLYLARTIVKPLRQLVRAAVRVRLGREREVVVPRLPGRRDEIALLARAISDMTTALRQRIDAVESFAADVAHEIKNPLASLRSALESLPKVKDPELHQQLMAIAMHDVQRIDRLVSEISDASRIDAELSRSVFEPLDLGALIANLVGAREDRRENEGRPVILIREGLGPFVVMGAPSRLERVIENLLDNAVSFSPPDGKITITLLQTDDRIELRICDQGPGIPEEERDKVFNRFHSMRPNSEDFGNHSGLGLAIARTIVEGHDGTLTIEDRADGESGACFVIALPMVLKE